MALRIFLRVLLSAMTFFGNHDRRNSFSGRWRRFASRTLVISQIQAFLAAGLVVGLGFTQQALALSNACTQVNAQLAAGTTYAPPDVVTDEGVGIDNYNDGFAPGEIISWRTTSSGAGQPYPAYVFFAVWAHTDDDYDLIEGQQNDTGNFDVEGHYTITGSEMSPQLAVQAGALNHSGTNNTLYFEGICGVAASTPAPDITAVAPTSGTTAGGTSVIITGTDLTGATALKFGDTDATSFTVDSATQITAETPAHSGGLVKPCRHHARRHRHPGQRL